jgi:hypothetical protein
MSVIGNPTTQVFIIAVKKGLTCFLYEWEALSGSEVDVSIGGYVLRKGEEPLRYVGVPADALFA